MINYWGSFLTLYYFTWVCGIILHYKQRKAVGTINNVMWLYLYQFGMLKFVQSPSWLLTTIIKSISTAQCSSVVSLLKDGYSHCQIQSRTGLGKGTVGRISNEVEMNKENNSGGRPSKLSACDKQSIVHQISSGKLDNTVQATQFINSIIHSPFTPQTVRNTLKESGFYSATKKKVPMLKLTHCQRWY